MITAVTMQVTRINNMDVNIVYENRTHIIHIYWYLWQNKVNLDSHHIYAGSLM